MGWLRRLGALARRDQLSQRLDEELQFHLAMREEKNVQEGMTPEQAHFDARRRFGNATRLKEQACEADLVTFLESIFQDFRFSARMLMKHRGFTAVALAGLAIGIGANTAVFTAYKAVVLQPVDARDPQRVVSIYKTSLHDPSAAGFSYPDFEYYSEHNRVFSGTIATSAEELALTGVEDGQGRKSTGAAGVATIFGFRFPRAVTGGAEFVHVEMISANYFSVLGVSPARGRIFPSDLADLQAHPAVLISDNYWQRRFDRDQALLGKAIKLNGAAFTIIGVTPHDFVGTNVNVPDIWMPIRLNGRVNHVSDMVQDGENICCRMYGRLLPGITPGAAQAEMNILAGQVRKLHAPHSEVTTKQTIHVFPAAPIGLGAEEDQPQIMWALRLVLVAVGLVLLIACANVASLQLARSAARQKEMGVRLSLGASRLRLLRQLLTESAVLGVLAGGFALLITWWMLRALVLQISGALPIEWGSLALHVEPDGHVFVYVLGVSLIAGVLFGLAPALESSRPDVSPALKEEGPGWGLRMGNARLRDLLLAIQVCVSLFLLIAAGLLVHASMRSVSTNPGYDVDHVLDLDINFPGGFGYTREKRQSDIRQLRERIEQMPGVRSVTTGRPPGGGGLRTAEVGSTRRTIYYAFIGREYFDALRIPLLLGRSFSWRTSGAEIVLSESAAKQISPDNNPLGKKVMLDVSRQYHVTGELLPERAAYQVVGVVKDVRGVLPGGVDSAMAYLRLPSKEWDRQPLLVAVEGNAQPMIAKIGSQVRVVDPNVVVYAEPLKDLLTATPMFVLPRISAMFASIIGFLGLLLAAVGIYGSVSYAVARRTREVGIRMALGASRAGVLKLILRETARPVLSGLAAGVLTAAGASYLLRGLLFGLSSLDPASFVGVSTALLLIALIAAYVPARAATRVDPTTALRYE